MFKRFKNLTLDVNNDLCNSTPFLIGTYSVLLVVAFGMTILNIITHKGLLTYATAVFAVLCCIDILLALLGESTKKVSKVFFAIETVILFTFFLISGNPEGFSAIWICMLPSLGMFFFGRYRGTVLCACMFAILAFFFWTPFGNSYLMYDYNATFKMRFPILFAAFHLLAYLLEWLRANAYLELNRLQEYYHDQSIRDGLTGLYNRQGMYAAVRSDAALIGAKRIGAAMFDIDYFKHVNDTYGHDSGDVVLCEFAEVLRSIPSVVCRWGGEEFVVVFDADKVSMSCFNDIRKAVDEYEFSFEENKIRLTVSAGVCIEKDVDLTKIDKLINKADGALYHAKKNGRNCIVEYKIGMNRS